MADDKEHYPKNDTPAEEEKKQENDFTSTDSQIEKHHDDVEVQEINSEIPPTSMHSNQMEGAQVETKVNQPSRFGWFVPMLAGIVLGIIIVIAFYNSPLNDNQGPNGDKQIADAEEDVDSDKVKNTDNQIVNVDVNTQVTKVVENVSHAVVGVTNIQIQANFWEQREGNETGTGSGVIYKKDRNYAYVVTNHHVIEAADAVEVVLADETTIEAEVLGSDIFTDLAVLRMEAKDVGEPIEMGNSDLIKVGEPAIAIGNPLGHMFSGTVTFGVISGKQRTIPVDLNQDGRPDWQAEVIQTDAAINPGNSGGALINIEGDLIGINSMKINEAAVEGIGFAIPINAARPIIEELEQSGEVTRAYLGVEIYSLEEIPQVEWTRTLNLPRDVDGGVYIWQIDRMSPSEQAGLKRLDVIVALDGKPIKDTIDLRKVLYQEKNVGDEIQVTYYRDGEEEETTIILGAQP